MNFDLQDVEGLALLLALVIWVCFGVFTLMRIARNKPRRTIRFVVTRIRIEQKPNKEQ